MSEARIRSLAQNSSKIFSGSQPERIKQRENPQAQSKIFKPLNIIPKPLTYARAQYEKTTICLGKDKNDLDVDSPPRNHPNLSPAGRKTGQAASTKYLIGNERSNFYKKSINEKIPVNENFEPRYANQSAFERKQKEFNNGWSPEREEKTIEKSFSVLSAKDRKMQDRVSIFDQKVYEMQESERRRAEADRKENVQPEYNPKDRRAENFSSEVFEKRKINEYKKPLEVLENEDTRKKNHMFSDLFGRASSPTREKVKDRLIPTDHYFAAYGRQNLDYSPCFQTNKNLSSQINFGETSQRTDRQRPQTPNLAPPAALQPSAPTPTPAQPQSSAELYSLDLSSISPETTSSSLKELCGGVHVVSLILQIDNFTGQCQGTGQLKVRTNDLSDLSRIEKVFKSRGILVKTSQLSLGRKSNYSEVSNVSWHHPYDYKKTSTPVGARESKMRNLESTFFEGQVKWTARQTESLKHELSAQLLWSNTKNASKGQY